MKASSIYSGLAALAACAQYATAEPIPHDTRLSVRERRAVHNFHKRGLMDDLIGPTGSGPRYWAWCRVAYDGQFHKKDEQKFSDIDGGSTDWALLAGDDITVWGYTGQCVGGWLGDVNTDMQNVVGLDNSNQIIVSSYKGTDGLPTLGQDLKFLQEDGPGGKVEKGFAQCARSVKDEGFAKIKELAAANPGWPIVFTGHSLGGATAHISAVSFVEENGDLKDRITVFTYGAPRAGGKDFQETLASNQGQNMRNFRVEGDPIWMEPLWPLDYYNPAMTYTIKSGGSWTDEGAWELKENVNNEGHGVGGGALDLAKAMFAKAKQHTGYFTGGNAARRAVEETIHAGALSKRDGKKLSADEVKDVEKQIDELSDDDLNDTDDDDAEDDDDKVGKILDFLGIDDKEGAGKELENKENAEDKRLFLRILVIASVETANSGGGIIGAITDALPSPGDVVDIIT